MKARWVDAGDDRQHLVDDDGKVLAGIITAWGVVKVHLPLFKDEAAAKSAVERAVGANTQEGE